MLSFVFTQAAGGPHLPKKPNYNYEKNRKEQERRKKKEEKRLRRLEASRLQRQEPQLDDHLAGQPGEPPAGGTEA